MSEDFKPPFTTVGEWIKGTGKLLSHASCSLAKLCAVIEVLDRDTIIAGIETDEAAISQFADELMQVTAAITETHQHLMRKREEIEADDY